MSWNIVFAQKFDCFCLPWQVLNESSRPTSSKSSVSIQATWRNATSPRTKSRSSTTPTTTPCIRSCPSRATWTFQATRHSPSLSTTHSISVWAASWTATRRMVSRHTTWTRSLRPVPPHHFLHPLRRSVYLINKPFQNVFTYETKMIYQGF